MDNDIAKIRNKVGSIPAIDGEACTTDNLAIALATYFESRLDCPEDDKNEWGWSEWATEKTDSLIDRAIATARAEALGD